MIYLLTLNPSSKIRKPKSEIRNLKSAIANLQFERIVPYLFDHSMRYDF